MAKYFKDSEFRKCDPPCSIEDMKPHFLETLDELRELCGIPLVLNCAYRSKEWDIAKNRSGNSAHTKGLAVDIRCNTSRNRYIIVKSAVKLGFKRIGIGKTFVHLDLDEELPQEVMFDYYE